jgi:type IV pilus assembly protein PilQ
MTFLSRIKRIPYVTLLAVIFATTSFMTTNALPDDAIISSIHPQVQDGRLSFYFQNIEIRSLLQILAKSSGMNFVINDAVKGSVTLNLKNVTWRQALIIILKSHGLSYREDGNVIYISTIDELANNENRQLQAEEQLSNLVPVSSAIFQLKYTSATDMAALLKGQQGTLLTSRGQVAVDTRTNSIIVRDTPKSINEVKRAIERLDVPAKQVLIEARIVTIDTTYEKQLGVRFGVSDTRHFSGTLNAANQIVGGTSPSQVISGAGGLPDATPRLNFNNAATQFASGANPGTVGLALGRLGHFLLDLELSALEENGHVNIISKPRVITSNQQKATIQTGTEIPYQEATSSGATSISFKKAVLSLEIVPQITPDNKIVLAIKATEDSPGAQIALTAQTTSTPATLGPPAINTQEVESNVILNDNETIVLGGIYQATKSSTLDRVPFFGSLPIVGALFRSKTTNDEKKELLIFITPKIIKSNHNYPTKTESQYAKDELNAKHDVYKE